MSEVEIPFGSGTDAGTFVSPWTYSPPSWHKLTLVDTSVSCRSGEPARVAITLFGRREDGSADTTNAITVDYAPGDHLSLMVKVDGLTVGTARREWDDVFPDNDPATWPLGVKVTYDPAFGVDTALLSADAVTWFGINVALRGTDLFPSYANVVPVIASTEPMKVDRFRFREFLQGAAPEDPDTSAPYSPIPVKNFAMTPDLWKGLNPNNPELPDWYFFRMEGTVAHFEYHSFNNAVYKQPFTVAENTGVLWEAMFPYDGPDFEFGVFCQSSGDSAYIAYAGGDTVTARWYTGSDSSEQEVTLSTGTPKFFRVYRRSNKFVCEASTNGSSWKALATSAPLAAPNAADHFFQMSMGGYVDILKVKGVTVGGNPDPTPPLWDPPEEPDPFDPNVLLPESKDGSSTLLDLVREFSKAVKRAVRITGPSSIAMVDPAVPLPAGMVQDDADDMYTNAGRGTGADTAVLSLNKGRVSLTSTCRVVTNDVRVVRSSWRIPDRLPVYGLSPAHVQRVSYTFTPTEFQASLDFRFRSLPLVTKEK